MTHKLQAPSAFPALMQADYIVSRRWWRLALLAQLAAMLVGAGTNLFVSGVWSVWSAACVLLLSALVYVCKYKFETAYQLAETVRRLIVLEAGLGWRIPPEIEARLRLRFSKVAHSIASKIEPAEETHNVTDAQPSPAKLAAVQREAIIDTVSLYGQASRITTVFLAGLLVLLSVALYAALSIPVFSTQTAVARFISIFAMSVLTAQAFGMFWNYRRLAVQIQHIDSYLESLRGSDHLPSVENILQAIHEYDCLVSSTPPPPIRRFRIVAVPQDHKTKTQEPGIPHIPTPFEQHQGFVLFASLAFSLLYAELGLFHTFVQSLPWVTAASIIGLASILTCLVYLASFTIPSRIYHVPQGDLPPQVLELLFQHWGAAAGIILAGTAIILGLYLYLTKLDLVAAYNLLKDLALYAAAGCALHGLLLYVRYAAYLYLVHQEDRLKMIVATASVGVLLVALALYLFTLDIMHLSRLEAAYDPQVGLLGLHIYGRGLFLAGIAFAAYAWHIRWIGDH